MSDGGYSDEDNSTIKLDDYNDVVRANKRLETENSIMVLKIRQLTSEMAKFKIETGVSTEFQVLVLASELLTKYENTVFIPDSLIGEFQKANRQTMGLLKSLALSEPLILTTEDIKCAKKIVLEATFTQQTLLSPFRKTAGLMIQAFNLLDYDCAGKFYNYKFQMSDGKKLGVRLPSTCQVRDDMKTAFITAYGRFIREEPEYWDKFIDQAIYMQVQSFLISITKWQDIALLRDDIRKREEAGKLEFEHLKKTADAERHEFMRKESDMRKNKRDYEKKEKEEEEPKIKVKKISVRTQTDEIELPTNNTAIMEAELVKLRTEKTSWLESKKEMRDQLRKQEQDLKDLERNLRLEKENSKTQIRRIELKKLEEMIIEANKENNRLSSENNNLSVDALILTNENKELLQQIDNVKKRMISLEAAKLNIERELDNRDDNMREAGVEADMLVGKLKETINEGLSRESENQKIIEGMADNIILLNKKIEYLDSMDATKKLKIGMQTEIDFSKLQSLNDKYSLKVRQICDAFYASGNAIESAVFVEDVIKRVFEKEIQHQAKELVKQVPGLESEVMRLKGQLNAMTQNTVEFQISQETGHLSELKEEVSKIFSSIVSKEINSFQHNMKILSSDMNNMMASWKTLPQKAKRFTELNKSDENEEEEENKTKSKGQNMEKFVGKNKEIKEETKIRTSIQGNKLKKRN